MHAWWDHAVTTTTITHLCLICLDDVADGNLLPCCGRAQSEERVCRACLSKICDDDTEELCCPVCREGLQWNGEILLRSSCKMTDRRWWYSFHRHMLSLLALLMRPFTDACLDILSAALSRGPV